MKYLASILILTFGLGCATLYAQTYDLRFLTAQHDGINGGTYSVVMQIKKGSGPDFTLGSSNFRFDFNSAGLSPKAPFIQVEDHFDDGLNHPTMAVPVYHDMTSTGTSSQGFASINIDLNVTNFGFPQIGAGSWISIATLTFTIIDNNQTSALTFRTSTPGNNVAFADDQTTILGQGIFQNLDEPLSVTGFPVELLDFEADVHHGYPRLSWITAREENSDRFEIEEMRQEGTWELIGRVTAAGFSDQEQSYSFSGETKLNGEAHYRLKMVDLDGSVEYSEIRTLTNEGLTLISAYPIPASEFLVVEGIRTDLVRQAEVSWYSLQGNLITTEIMAPGSAAATVVNVPGVLSPGIYLLRISSDSGILLQQKITVR